MWMQAMSPILTENEVNNLIFTLIKYTFQKLDEKLKNPSNKFIKRVMVEVMDNPITSRIITTTYNMVINEYRIGLLTCRHLLYHS